LAARAAEASEADALGWIIHRVILGADAAGVADVAYLEQKLGEEVDDIKALHQGGEQHWAARIQQTASMWLNYDGIPAKAHQRNRPTRPCRSGRPRRHHPARSHDLAVPTTSPR
jgi:hypothetical protein